MTWCNSVMRLFAAVAIGGLPLSSADVQSKEVDLNTYIAQLPIAGLPEGLFAKWTDDQKRTAFKRIGGFCQFLCVDSYANITFANAAAAEKAKAEVKVCLGACIVNHLPSDYPDLAGMKQDLRANYEKAKQLGSSAPWPLPGK